MALFGKKPMTAEEIIKAIQSLDESELEKVISALSGEESAEEPAGETEEPEAPAESTEAEGEEPAAEEQEQETAGEPAGEVQEPESAPEEAEAETGEETAQTEEEPPEETDAEHEAETEETEAANARIAALETEIASLKEMMENIVSQLDDKPFGQSPTPPQAEEDEEDDRIMRSYYGAGYNRAKV